MPLNEFFPSSSANLYYLLKAALWIHILPHASWHSTFVLFSVLFFFLSESGKLITWGSTDDLGQSYVTSGKHGVEQPYIVPSI